MQHQAERRLLTLLFADLSGFTPLSQNLDPEALSETIDLCFESLNRIITRHGGTIHKYEGDLIIALFGLPTAHEDDPERAINAAMEMTANMASINKSLKTKLKLTKDLGIHVGINIGTVFAGEIGSREKKEYTVIGEAVNFASRLKDIAQNGQIIVSQRLYRLTRYLYDYQTLPPVLLKGFAEPINVFLPLNRKEHPEPKRGLAGLSSPLVERSNEMAALDSRLQKFIRDRTGGVVFILGEAGIGKSRLLEELKQRVNKGSSPFQYMAGYCQVYGESLTYHPIIGILKKFFSIAESDTLQVQKEKITAVVRLLLPNDYLNVLPYIGSLLSIPMGSEIDERTRHLDAQDLKLQISVAVNMLIKTAAKNNPLVVVIEDYHWIDSASLHLLEFMLSQITQIPVLAICLSRPDKNSKGFGLKESLKKQNPDCYLEINLKPLSVDASRQLADNLLNRSALTTEVKNTIVSKADGNPFFIEEILRSLMERGLLFHESGSWQAKPQLTIADIPDNIQGIIFARLDKLDPDEKMLVQKAAVIGRNFNIRILEELAGTDQLMLSYFLATLTDLDYVTMIRHEPELEYMFKHPILHEVIYQSIPKKTRIELHAKIARTLEEIYHQSLEEHTDMIAYHYSESDNIEKAVSWLLKAGTKARNRYANDEAIKFFQKTISIIEAANEPLPGYLAIKQTAWKNLGLIFHVTGAYSKALAVLDALYQSTAEEAIRADALYLISENYRIQGQYNKALEILAQADRIAPDETAFKSTSLIARANIHRIRGETTEAIDAFTRCVQITQSSGNKKNHASAITELGSIYATRGDYERALENFVTAVKIFEELGDKRQIGFVYGNIGIIYAEKNEHDKALEFDQKSLQIAEETGFSKGISTACVNISRLFIEKRDYVKAQEYLLKAQKIAEENNTKTVLAAALGNLAVIFRETKEYEKAETSLLRIIAILQESTNNEFLTIAYRNLAEILMFKEKHDQALIYAAKSMDLAKNSDSKNRIALNYQLYSRIYIALKDLSRAEEFTELGAKIFLEIGQPHFASDIYESLSEAMKDQGQAEKAEIFKNKATAIAAQNK